MNFEAQNGGRHPRINFKKRFFTFFILKMTRRVLTELAVSRSLVHMYCKVSYLPLGVPTVG